ncbi:MAG: aminotransferase class V-fold PLP-dependent enzyme [Dehalococcoidia bacterium]|nr:aminotransferase class V-fold PLP-dependent enzyme [Dehalococcoidia bacterium]
MNKAALDSLRERGAIYEKLGVKPIINAMGTQTVNGGSIMEPEVIRAMAEGSRVMVRMKDLNARASEIIAGITGAEAGMVVAGAATGMMLQAAACMTGNDPAKISRLPDTSGMKNEIIIKQNQNFGFIKSWSYSGARLVWVGNETGASPKELEAAITEKTAAFGYLSSRWAPDSFETLDEMIAVGRKHKIPVLVDAAAMLPPAHHLRAFVDRGADMVTFSGGKALKGPQSTGILAGKKNLIEAAAMNGSPSMAIGRVAKVCREEIVGVLVALQRYAEKDHAADQRRWLAECKVVQDALKDVPDITSRVMQDDWLRPVPELSIGLGKSWLAETSARVKAALNDETPPIIVGASRRPGEDLFVNPHGLQEGEADFVGQRLRAAMLAAHKQA